MIVFIAEILTFNGNLFKAARTEGAKGPGASRKAELGSIFSKCLRKAGNSGVGDSMKKQGTFGGGGAVVLRVENGKRIKCVLTR